MSNFSIPILLLITIGIKGSQYLIRNYSNKRNYNDSVKITEVVES